jgi:hypothetical protein
MCTRHLLSAPIIAGLPLLIALSSLAGEVPSKEKIDQLIEKLGSGDFTEREKATKELSAIGAPALEALRKAAKSKDVEVRKRAEALLSKSDNEREIPRVLAPKRVRLVYKDATLKDALEDLQKKSGYSVDLCDPSGKLKERKITLDTGETTFWHAVGLFCEKARLTEGNIKDLKPHLPVEASVVIGNGSISKHEATEHLILKEGKRGKWPADDRGAIRVRAVGKYDSPVKVPEDEVVLALELSREPTLQWQLFLTIRIDKAVDDRGQDLTQVIPGAKEGDRSGFGGIRIPVGTVVRPPAIFPGSVTLSPTGKIPGLSLQVPLQLRKREKAAKSIAELKGFITAALLTEAAQGNEKGQRAKPVLPAPRRTTVNIPFSLKNVPLP